MNNLVGLMVDGAGRQMQSSYEHQKRHGRLIMWRAVKSTIRLTYRGARNVARGCHACTDGNLEKTTIAALILARGILTCHPNPILLFVAIKD